MRGVSCTIPHVMLAMFVSGVRNDFSNIYDTVVFTREDATNV
jgi:hypothetical protein